MWVRQGKDKSRASAPAPVLGILTCSREWEPGPLTPPCTGSCSVLISICSPFRHHWIFYCPVEQKNDRNSNKNSPFWRRWENPKVRNHKRSGLGKPMGSSRSYWCTASPRSSADAVTHRWQHLTTSVVWDSASLRIEEQSLEVRLCSACCQPCHVGLVSDSLAAARAEPRLKMLLSVACK